MLELAHGLPDDTLTAIADLERRVVAADGGRLKLEWGVLRSRPGDRVDDLLWWDGGRLLGFLGIYAFGAPTVELTGMVDPQARRRGIATALLEQALPLGQARGYSKTLLVTPRTPTAARDFARRWGGVLDHSEYALQLTGEPAEAPTLPGITLRPMAAADTSLVRSLLKAGFGWEPPESEDDDAQVDRANTLVVDRDGLAIGTVRVNRVDDTAGVYGFVIHADHQGQGIGRDVLRRIARRARRDGAARVHLEVAVDNDRALALYTSLGFSPIATEDYYALPGVGKLAGAPPGRRLGESREAEV